MRKKSHHRQAQDIDELCAEPREADGIPPSILAKRQQQEHRHINYHGEQLCKQVRIALGEALICDCAGPTFADLQVIEVRMSSGTTALEVIITSPNPDDDLETRLRKAEGLPRASISNAITRKRLPRLGFRQVPAEKE